MSDPNNPYGPPNGSDPYGQSSGGNPYDPPGGSPNPYGQPQYGTPYGAGGYGAPGTEAKTDGVSIASFVLSLLCCTGLIGMILGFVGLSRTKDGKRKGRWMAVAGIVIGAVTLVGALAVGAITFFIADQVVTPGNAEVGQCVDIEDVDGDVAMVKKDCTDEHDGEIVGVADITADNRDDVADRLSEYCSEVVSAEDRATIDEFSSANGTLQYRAVTQDPDDVEAGDRLVCYVEGDDLTEPIL
ncbi:DUF4190 domain-containing protein [Nocardioides sambongensis]|uniref:DUF4190 domain-containing protein n=1 Tax=Nocardioides sambongensis TaxID=2589074 RepID=UPI00112E6748|nr:DUF4190 domain-containing protein [Nocardioides sambongensis]